MPQASDPSSQTRGDSGASGPIERPMALEGAESQPLGSPGDPPAAESPDWLPLGLAGFGFAVLAWTLVRMYIRRKNSTSAREMARPPKERLSDIRAQAASRREPLEELMADATELAQRLAAQLDNKAERLEQLLAEADDAIARLQGEGHEQRQAESRASGFSGQAGESRSHAMTGNGAGSGNAPGSASGSLGRQPFDPYGESDPVRARVYQLADAGVEAGEIARQVNQPRGQVELMLALRRA